MEQSAAGTGIDAACCRYLWRIGVNVGVNHSNCRVYNIENHCIYAVYAKSAKLSLHGRQ